MKPIVNLQSFYSKLLCSDYILVELRFWYIKVPREGFKRMELGTLFVCVF